MDAARLYCLVVLVASGIVCHVTDKTISESVTMDSSTVAASPSDAIPDGCIVYKQSENGTFSREGELTVVCGRNASLDDIPQHLPDNVTHLVITEQDIPIIRSRAFVNKNLKTLIVQNCNVTAIEDGAFKLLNNLQYLDLSENNLESSGLRNDSFRQLASLIHLSLMNNPLHEIQPATFLGSEDYMYSLEVINLSATLLVKAHIGAFQNFSSLQTVDMSHNLLTETTILSQCDINEFQSIYQLNLSSNSINSIVSDERCFEQLKTLDLSFNNITELDEDSLKGVHDNLEELFLSHNKIRSIYSLNRTFNWPGVKLRVVDLSYNHMQQLSEDDLGPVTRLVVHHNPWHCDCTVSWFVYTDSVSQNNHYDHVKCASPSSVANKSVFSLRPKFIQNCPDFPDDPTDHTIPNNVTAIVLTSFGVVFGVLLASGLTYAVRKRARYRRLREEVRRQLVTSDHMQTQHEAHMQEASSRASETPDINTIEALLYLPNDENTEHKLHTGEAEPDIRGRLELF